MGNVAILHKTAVSRPLKILVPLIQHELIEGDEAGLQHYRRAGEMLMEAREQVPHGSWGRWLSKNFELSQNTALRYMRFARKSENEASNFIARGESLTKAIGEKRAEKPHVVFKSLFEATGRVNVTRLADERKSRDEEIKLHRDLAIQLIDLGYRALATRLHPDRGGSRDAMMRLNTVRDELKSIAETRRFV